MAWQTPCRKADAPDVEPASVSQSAGSRSPIVLPEFWQPVCSLPDAVMLANIWLKVSSASTTKAFPAPGTGGAGGAAGVSTAPGVSGTEGSLDRVANCPFRLALRPCGLISTSARSPFRVWPNASNFWGSTFISPSLIGSGSLAPTSVVKSGLKEKLTRTGSKWVPKIVLLMAMRPSRIQLQTDARQFTWAVTWPDVVDVATTHFVAPGQSLGWVHRMLGSASQWPVVNGFGAEVPSSCPSVMSNFTPMPVTDMLNVVSTTVSARQTPGVQMSVKGTQSLPSVLQYPPACRVIDMGGRLMATLILSFSNVTGQLIASGSMSMWDTVVVTVGLQEQPPLTDRWSTALPFGMSRWMASTKVVAAVWHPLVTIVCTAAGESPTTKAFGISIDPPDSVTIPRRMRSLTCSGRSFRNEWPSGPTPGAATSPVAKNSDLNVRFPWSSVASATRRFDPASKVPRATSPVARSWAMLVWPRAVLIA